jgi:Protein of unknown function (DUF760)
MNQPVDFGGHHTVGNHLWQYVTKMEPETVARLSQPASEEVMQVMERSVLSLLGHLPAEDFSVSVTTSRENLGRLLASAMLNGYFLRTAEQRMNFEGALLEGSPLSDDSGQ